MDKARKSVEALLIAFIRFYQLVISPWMGRRCRYEPGCSEYMQEAVSRFGPVKGLLMGLKRLSTCHPWGGEGLDPVPERTGKVESVAPMHRCTGING